MIAAVLAVALLAQAPDSSSPSPTSDALREARLAKQRQELETELAAIDAFGHVDEFRDGLHALAAKAVAAEENAERWVPVTDGWLPMMAVDHWLLWHQPAEGKSVPVALDFEQANHPFATIVDLATQLEQHDVDFLLVVFPSRLQLYPELVLPALVEQQKSPSSFRGMVGATTRFLLALNAKGVEVLNLAPTFIETRHVETAKDVNGELYLVRNKHWTPRAARIAAQAVAGRARALPWFTEGPVKEGTSFKVMPHDVPFMSGGGGQSPDKAPETLPIEQVRPTGGPANAAETRRSPIVVLSDSFSKFYVDHQASFVDQLRRFTGHPIDAITPMGGAELQCREMLVRRGDRLRGKKLVIWLLQEDNLRPDPAFRPIDLFAE